MSASLKSLSYSINNVEDFYKIQDKPKEQTNLRNSNNNNKEKKVKLSFQEFCKIDQPLTNQSTLENLEKTRIERYASYKGKINLRCTKPQYVNINDVSQNILFSQETVSDYTRTSKNDLPLSDLADMLFEGFLPEYAIDIVDNGDGTFTSLDNRRLLIAKRIGVVDRTYGIWLRVHAADQELNIGQQKRFNAYTWGEAAAIRVNNNKVKGYDRYPTILDGLKKKPDQNIYLRFDSDNDYSALNEEDFQDLKSKIKNGNIAI